MNTWHDLAAAIGVAPAFKGARCRGLSHLFDPAGSREPAEVAAQRHRQALELCSRCPSLAACADWLDGLPKAKRPAGVVAGKAYGSQLGRPRRSA